jgi:DNA-binding MarR family transcriptional regulator
MVVRLVGRRPGISAGALAETLSVHPSTLTGVLARLVQKGIITRTSDPADARRVKLRLTPRGEALAAVRTGTVEEQFRRALARATPSDVAATQRVLKLIAEALARPDLTPPRGRSA